MAREGIAVNPVDARNRAAVDINFFAGLCIPEVVRFQFPDYYVALFNFIARAISAEHIARILRFAIGLPRGFSKTTFLKILVVWLIVNDRFSFFIINCATEPLSQKFVADVHKILCSNNIKVLYGDWEKRLITDNAGEKKSDFRDREVILIGIGSGSAIRGINEDNKRPDFILCDDAQTKECDDSDTESEHFIDWALSTLFKCVDPVKSCIAYIGNMYSERCLLFKLKEHPHWVSLVTGCILEDGTSLWPELHPLESLMESFEHDEALNKADTWFAEMMNDPVAKSNALLSGPLPLTRYDRKYEPDAAFLTIDPAGFKDGADDNVVTGHVVVNDKWHIAEMDGGKWDPKQLIQKATVMAIRLGANLIGVEDVAYQATLMFWFNEIFKENNITGIQVIGLKVSGASKETRLRTFVKEMYGNQYSFLRDTDRLKFTWQGRAYRAGKKNNKDDWLDSPSLGLVVRNQFRHMLGIRRENSDKRVGVVENNAPF